MSVKISTDICPTCGGLVAFNEDAIMIRALAAHNPEMVMSQGARHIHCDPDIAQYINHPSFMYTLDGKTQYEKRQSNPNMVAIKEEVFTEAWACLQVSCGMTVSEHRRTFKYGEVY